ncbi:hypothetical protein FACS189418_4900 [Clostridia bacterium]|nr:hypothetical protein FACS189418_4900 [Clostridia bacterium]
MKENIRLLFPFSVPSSPIPQQIFFYVKDDKLVSILSLHQEQQQWKAIAFTHPDERHKGYFSALFHAAIKQIKNSDHYPLLFYQDHQSVDTEKTLLAIPCQYLYSEILMQKDDLHPPLCIPSSRFKEQDLSLLLIYENKQLVYQAYLQNHLVASCRIYLFTKSFYFFDLYVQPFYRQKGYAQHFLCKIFKELEQYHKKPLRLQVNSKNLHALHLYKKLNFYIQEKLSYYIYNL